MNDADAVNQVCTYLKKKITTKALFPGNRIVEETLAKETGTSRTTIRAALQKLKYEGFVDIQKNRGTSVVQPTLEDIHSVYAVRRALEVIALEIAIPQFSEEAIQKMSDCLEAQKNLKTRFSIAEYALLNRDFHWVIVEQARNAYLEKYLNELYNQVYIIIQFYDSSVDNTGSLRTHAAILDAIQRRDVAAGIQGIIQDNILSLNDMHAL